MSGTHAQFDVPPPLSALSLYDLLTQLREACDESGEPTEDQTYRIQGLSGLIIERLVNAHDIFQADCTLPVTDDTDEPQTTPCLVVVDN
jgi:hypothetical protein